MIKAKQLADRLPAELLPKTQSCSALLTAVSQLKTDRNNALLRVDWLTQALEIIAGRKQCVDNTLSNVAIAEIALDFQSSTSEERSDESAAFICYE